MFQLGEKIPVKFSGDGAKFSRTSNMMILSFSILVPQVRYLSGTGKCVCVCACVCVCVCVCVHACVKTMRPYQRHLGFEGKQKV